MAALTIEQALQTAIAHHQAGRLAQAEEIYRQILAVQPGHADAWHLLGAAALQSGRHEQALDFIQRALALAPNHPVYESNLGETYRRLGRHDEAIAHLQRAVALQPDHADGWNNLGSALGQKRQWKEAIACFQRVAALRPGDASAHKNLVPAYVGLGEECLKLHQWDDAAAACEHALALRPDCMEALGNLALVYRGQDRLEEAIACNQRALAITPHVPALLTNLAECLEASGRYDEALTACQQALEIRPDFAEAHWARAHLLLRLGKFEEGWREAEWRWQTMPLANYRRSFSVPEWDGTPAPGRTILAHAEQGYGDAILFLRYVLELRKKPGIDRVLLECGRPLTRLMAAAVVEDATVFPRETLDGRELPPFDLHIPWHSLPLALGIFEPLPMAAAYLHADPALRAMWRERLGPRTSFRVGLAWSGNPDFVLSRRRSIAPKKLLPLLKVPGATFYSLQVEPRNGTPAVLVEAGLIDLTGEVADFSDTAALLAELDLLIVTDGGTAHLAGAMGCPVWTLLAFVPDWRWGLEREDTPWYPTMRLFRQPAPGDWDSVLRRVEQLCAEAAARR